MTPWLGHSCPSALASVFESHCNLGTPARALAKSGRAGVPDLRLQRTSEWWDRSAEWRWMITVFEPMAEQLVALFSETE